MHILSVSIGGNELDVPRDYLIIEAQYMANLASAGVTILVASGDMGATVENQVQTTCPTSDPDVTGVGGTTLVMNPPDTAVATESRLVGKRRGNKLRVHPAALADGDGSTRRQHAARAGCRVGRGSDRRRPDSRGREDIGHRRDELVRTHLGRVLRSYKPEARHPARPAQSQDIPPHRLRLVSRHHVGQQRDVQRGRRLRLGHGDRRSRCHGAPRRKPDVERSPRHPVPGGRPGRHTRPIGDIPRRRRGITAPQLPVAVDADRIAGVFKRCRCRTL